MSAPKRRIAHVITRMCHGGAQENTLQTVIRANTARYEVDLICGPTPRGERNMDKRIDSLGATPTIVPSLKRPPNPIADTRALHHLTQLFRERQYDLVHTHTSKAGFLGRMAARRAGVKHVVHTPHGHIFHGYFTAPIVALYTQMERRVAAHTSRIIALTDDEVTAHLARAIGSRDQYAVIHSGIDVGAYATARRRRAEIRRSMEIPSERCVVLGVGRLEPVKGFTYFIQAAKAVQIHAPNAEFWLAGEGSLRADLEAEAARLDVPIRFWGWCDDLPTYMAAADMLVLPSVNEGMGRVIAEAGAAHLPVIASETGGIPHIVVNGETGLLVEPENYEALAEAITKLSRDEAQREAMGAAGYERINAGYSVDAMVRQIEDLYEELITNDPID